MRAFFQMNKHLGYKREEDRYLKTYAAGPLSPLINNGPRAYLCAMRDDKCVFRALTGVDMRYVQTAGKKAGYFSLFEGEKDAEAAKAVMDKIMLLQRKWGMDEVVGPISPDGSGFFMGAGDGEFKEKRGILTGVNAEFSSKILRDNGFSVLETENAYEIEIGKENPLSAMSRKAGERFGLKVERMNPGVFSEKWKRDIASVSDDLPEEELLRTLDRIRKFICPECSFIAFSKDVPLGYLLTLKDKDGYLRATTLMTKKGVFTPPVVIVLAGAFWDACIDRAVKTCEVSMINDKNYRSYRLVLRFGGRKTRAYTQFTKNVRQN